MPFPNRPANVDWVQVPTTVNTNIAVPDVLDTLAAEATKLAQPAPGVTPDPALAPLVQQFTDLTNQLKDVIAKINQIDPTFLAGGR